MLNGTWAIFVSKSGRMDDMTYCKWIETADEELYKKALAAVEPRGWKVAKIYYPTDNLEAPDFTKAVRRIRIR